jgi:hypothetical protein
MPYTASLKGSSKTILASLAKSGDGEKDQSKLLSIALGISIPTDDTVVSKFRGEEFESIALLLANDTVDVSSNPKKQEMLATKKTIALIGSSVQRFILAGFEEVEGLPSLENNENLTSDFKQNAEAFEKYKAVFLQKAKTYQDAAMQLAKNWLLQYKESLAAYEIVDYDMLHQDTLFQSIYNYIEECFKTDSSFQKEVLSDAKQFVERSSERYALATSQQMTRSQKAIIRYHSVLHFLEQAAVFNVLWARYKIDAFAYPGQEIATHAALKNDVIHHQKLVELIQVEITEFTVAQKPISSLEIVIKREHSPRNGSSPTQIPTPSNSNQVSPIGSEEGSQEGSPPGDPSGLDGSDEEKQPPLNRKRASSTPKERTPEQVEQRAYPHSFSGGNEIQSRNPPEPVEVRTYPHSFSGSSKIKVRPQPLKHSEPKIPAELLGRDFLETVKDLTGDGFGEALGAIYGTFFAKQMPNKPTEVKEVASSSEQSFLTPPPGF